jgi:hypothetical protein
LGKPHSERSEAVHSSQLLSLSIRVSQIHLGIHGELHADASSTRRPTVRPYADSGRVLWQDPGLAQGPPATQRGFLAHRVLDMFELVRRRAETTGGIG